MIEMDAETNGFYVDIGDSAYVVRRPINKVDNADKLEGQTLGRRAKKINDGAQRCIDTLYGDDVSADGLPACYADYINSNIRIWKEEKYNKPPIIMVKDLLTHHEKAILELNPQYKNIRFGEIKLINWVDKNGNSWNGGIVLPPEFKIGKRYPVVVQAEGFDPNHFLIDGVYFATAPHAARALADKNIIVLQIAAPKDPNLHFDRNMAEMAAGVDAVLELLDEQNLIDTSKLGFIGFSSLGRFVFNMTVFPRFRPLAVVIADAASPSPFAYSYFYGTPYPGMLTQERLACDNWPWGEGQKEWIARNPYYHLDKIESAILLHEYTPGLSDWWDVFAGLKRLKKPVEFRQYTAGKHPPLRPDLIIEDQELTVEWFDFWLNGNENDNKGKKEQYKRWREFKASMEKMAGSSDGKMMLSNMKCVDLGNVKK